MAKAFIEPRLFTVEEAASYMGVAISTFSQMRKAGTLPLKPVEPFKTRYDKKAIDAWLDKQSNLNQKNEQNASSNEWMAALE